jgi:phenylacetate-CoA ligase
MVSYRSAVPGEGPFAVFPVLKHAHRTSGFFKVRGVNISHADLEDLIFGLSMVSDFKCEAIAVEDQDALRVSVETARGADCEAAMRQVSAEIKRVFEISPQVLRLEPGTLAAEFESGIKAPRMMDRRNEQP